MVREWENRVQVDAGTLLALGALAVAAAALVLARRGAPASSTDVAGEARAAREAMAAQVGAVQQAVQGQAELLQQAIGELRTANTTSMTELSGSTQRALGDLATKLGALDRETAHLGELAKDIGTLHDLLRAPKPRGAFGELLLERLLADALPADAFRLQYGYRDGTRVDAVVMYGERLVPIDAKFPMESFNAMAAATDDAERRTRRRAFLQQVRRHVESVAKYVQPQERAIDLAFMYIPSETVYYAAAVQIEGDDPFELRDICAQQRVLPVSPNTLVAYLEVVALGLRGLAMQERTRELQSSLSHVRREFDGFRSLHAQLGHHLDNATKKFAESERALDKADGALEGLTQVPLAGGAEQSVLPLPKD